LDLLVIRDLFSLRLGARTSDRDVLRGFLSLFQFEGVANIEYANTNIYSSMNAPPHLTMTGRVTLVGLNHYAGANHRHVQVNQPIDWDLNPNNPHHDQAMPVSVLVPATGQLTEIGHLRAVIADAFSPIAELNHQHVVTITLTPTGPRAVSGQGFGKYRHEYSGVMPCDFAVTVNLQAYQLLTVNQQQVLDGLLVQADNILTYWSVTPAVCTKGRTIVPHYMEVTNYQTT